MIGQPAIKIRLRCSRRARRLTLRVSHSGQGPVLTFPPGVPLAKARDFLESEIDWLRQRLKNVPERICVRDGTRLPFRGCEISLRHRPGGQFGLDGDQLILPGRSEEVPVRSAVFLREKGREACIEAVARHSAQLGLPHGRVTMRDTRSRWGSCTAAGNLMFSWRLILAPDLVLDYVAAHEVAHLQELNHSSRFWDVVHRLLPDYQEPRRWLRQNGAGLHAWDFSPSEQA